MTGNTVIAWLARRAIDVLEQVTNVCAHEHDSQTLALITAARTRNSTTTPRIAAVYSRPRDLPIPPGWEPARVDARRRFGR